MIDNPYQYSGGDFYALCLKQQSVYRLNVSEIRESST